MHKCHIIIQGFFYQVAFVLRLKINHLILNKDELMKCH